MKKISLYCPKCQKGKLFKSFLHLKLKSKCSNCSLDFENFDIGDGPAYIGICIVSILVPILAIIIEVNYAPALYIHALLWVPSIIIFSYVVLVFSKAMFIAIEYKIKKSKGT